MNPITNSPVTVFTSRSVARAAEESTGKLVDLTTKTAEKIFSKDALEQAAEQGKRWVRVDTGDKVVTKKHGPTQRFTAENKKGNIVPVIVKTSRK